MYIIKYRQKEKADNVYITEEFRNVDMIREAQGQPSLLPLLPEERKIVSDSHFVFTHFQIFTDNKSYKNESPQTYFQ